MTSVPAVPGDLYTDTQTRVAVHPLSVAPLLVLQADAAEVSA